MEERTFFRSGQAAHRSAAWKKASDTHAVVITHPHPLYGGNRDNTVVIALRRAYSRQGFSTLRFNFRGWAKRGPLRQRVGERQDVSAALGFFGRRGEYADRPAGYSFGAGSMPA